MSVSERYLILWVALCIALGLGVLHAIGIAEIGRNLPKVG